MPDIAYLDSSAFVKLVVRETETAALRRFLKRWPRRASSALVRAEAVRAVRRAGAEAVARTLTLLRRMHLVALDDEMLERAGLLDPVTLRTLDAIHLATALSLQGDLGVVITYDERMAEGARALGLRVAVPG